MKHGAVFKFLIAEEETPVNIYKKFQTACHDEILDDCNAWRKVQRLVNDFENFPE